jgi:ABC-type transport system involved in multi-copper enzyme maturation permease subunit
MRLPAAWTVFTFDFRRALTWRRLLIGLGLALFPVAMIALVQYQGAHLERNDRAELALFLLIPQVICVLGLLLWATPAISSELEAKTWTYLTVRPVDRGSILAGKYLAAVAWTVLCAWLSLALCLGVLSKDMDVLRLGGSLGLLVLGACLVYGALYTMIGVLAIQRAWVAAVAYTALMEYVVAWIPATINQFSVQHHLRCLLMKWVIRDPSPHGPGFDIAFASDWPAWQHVALLAGFAVALLTVAVVVLRRRQLVGAAEA